MSLLYFFATLFVSVRAQQTGSAQNVSISNVSPDISYTPFFCDASNTSASNPDCNGGWRLVDVNGSSVVSTNGPSVEGANLIPQMFLRFRATSLFMTTSPLSNATMNITVFTGTTVISQVANSSLGLLLVVNLNEENTTTLSITYISDQDATGTIIPSRLDIGSITVSVSNPSASSSILPTQTLPPSISLPVVLPTSTSSSTPSPSATQQPSNNNNRKSLIANAVGLTLGLGLGLTAVACIAYVFWRRRRRMRKREFEAAGVLSNMEAGAGAQVSSNYDSDRPKRPARDNRDTRWFNF